MRKSALFLLLAASAYGQITNPSVKYVPSAPSGSCAKSPPLQVYSAGNALYICGSGGTYVAINSGSGTFNALSGDATSTATGGATVVQGLKNIPFCTGFTPTNAQFLTLTTASAPNPCWTATGGVSSFTGDGSLLSNSASTGSVTATLANAGAHKYWGNNTGGSAAPGYVSIVAGDLPSIPLSGLATQAADTVDMNATAGSAAPTAVVMPACAASGHADVYDPVTHTWSCNALTSGTVTSVATTGPITGGTITSTGTIACATCVTSAASLTSNAVVIGGGTQASSTIAASSTTTNALFATAGAPAFRAIVAGDLPTIPLSGLATETANTVVGNGTGSTAAPTALAVPSCSAASSALTWTSGTGFGCNTISGSGTVNSGTAGHFAYYASSTTAVSSNTKLDDGITTAGTLTYNGGIASTPAAGAPGSISFVGNTTPAALTANNATIMGPSAATFTNYGLQLSTTGPAAAGVLLVGAPSTNVSQVTYGLVPLTDMATQAANTLVINATGGSASPTAVAMPSSGTNGCAGASDALTYNTTTHALGCNTISGSGTVTDGAGSTTVNQLAVATAVAHVQSYVTTLPTAAEPAHTGDVTNSGGSLAMTIAANAVTGAKMANNTVTATQLAAQYSKGACTEVWGGTGAANALASGDDAISNNTCYNDSGVTRTITAVKCRSDNGSNTTTVNPTFGSSGTGTTVLSGALTCGNSYAYSSSGTVSNASWTTGTGIDPAMSGTLTGTSIAMIVEYTF